MRIIELVIDENAEVFGMDTVSMVEFPAIERNFVALKNDRVEFKTVDEDKRIIMGAALTPKKPIYRVDEEGDYYVYFTEKTVRRGAELFFREGFQSSVNIEHDKTVEGVFFFESWIVEGEQDKSRIYGLDEPVGTWMLTAKVENDEVWNDYVKTGKVKGWSIEGYFADKVKMQKTLVEELEEALAESYADYPEGVKNNAKRGIELNEKNGNKCATQVGKVRAQQLAKGEAVSLETIKRMYSYLSRAEGDYDENDTSACGTISYLLWGGKSALGWSRNKLRELGELD